MSRVQALVEALFEGAVPPAITDLVRPSVAESQLEDFKVGPVLPGESDRRPARAAIADSGEPRAWQATVQRHWPGCAALLRAGPPGCRRMVDTEGRAAVVYLDDLQDHPVPSPAWLDHPLMCLTWESGGRGRLGVISRPVEQPWALLPPALRAHAAPLQGAPGLWGLRWRKRRVESLLWVSEARWRGNPDEANALLRPLLSAPARWDAMAARAGALGLLAYPDAVDVFADGRIDATMGFLVPAG